MIIINGTSLTVEQVAAVARTGEQVAISDEAKAAVNKARAYVEKKLDEKAVVYGLTTGFGKFSDKYIPLEDTAALQRNLIISHSCGMGNPLPTEVVRAAMLLRCNALCRGNSGIRLSTIETLLSMLNKGVHPIVPEKGSLGASGDLAPLSHMVLVMLGEGRAEYKGEIMSGREAMAAAGIPTVELAAKEGLALINGTQIMTAVGCLAVYDAVQLTKTADIACAMTAEALFGIKKAYDPKVHAVRGHKGQINSAKNLLTLLEGSKLAFDTIPGKVQDAYALRCTPQVHGASRDAIEYVYNAVSREINAVGGYYAFGRELMNGNSVFDFDTTKLSVHTLDIGLAGIEVYDILRDEYDIQIEFGDIGNILAYLSMGDRPQELERLVSALAEIRRRYQKDATGMLTQEYIEPEVVTSPQEAFYAPKISVPLAESEGRVCSEFVMCYPPGIPILAPGERITGEILEHIGYAKEKGCSMTGSEDPDLTRINVLE